MNVDVVVDVDVDVVVKNPILSASFSTVRWPSNARFKKLEQSHDHSFLSISRSMIAEREATVVKERGRNPDRSPLCRRRRLQARVAKVWARMSRHPEEVNRSAARVSEAAG